MQAIASDVIAREWIADRLRAAGNRRLVAVARRAATPAGPPTPAWGTRLRRRAAVALQALGR